MSCQCSKLLVIVGVIDIVGYNVNDIVGVMTSITQLKLAHGFV